MSYLDKNKDTIFKKYSNEELIRDWNNCKNGKGRLYKVLNHFFEEEMYKCKGGRGNLSPLEALSDDKIVERIISFTKSKPKFYTSSEIGNIKSFFRNAGRIAQKVANFPIRESMNMYEEYSNPGDTVFDPSCGFGARMCGALISNRNYIGTDPNISLTERLISCGSYLSENKLIDNTYSIIPHGSETHISGLDNKVSMCFTSPPYFDLEKYGDTKLQSINQFPDYQDWLTFFVKPTIENCSLYLKENGYFIINIKNMTNGKKLKLYDDWLNLTDCLSNMKYIETIELKQSSKREYKGKHFSGVNTDFGVKEPVFIFQKIK